MLPFCVMALLMIRPVLSLHDKWLSHTLVIGSILTACSMGCSDRDYLVAKSDVFAPIKRPFQPETWIGPTLSQRSLKTLQRFNLVSHDDSYWSRNYSRSETLERLQASIQHDPTPEKLYALTELAFLDSKTLLNEDKHHAALERFTLVLVYAYDYLFTSQFDYLRNPYDPQFHEICKMYNQSLEQVMRIIASDGQLKSGATYGLQLGEQQVNVEVRLPNLGPEAEIADLRFVSDFRIQKLLRHHQTFGLGVPMIGIRNGKAATPATEQYHPPGMSLPLTAFMKVTNNEDSNTNKPVRQCLLEFHNTVDHSAIVVNRLKIPLQTDTSIPLAFLLDQPALRRPREAATTSLLNPTEAGTGLFMMEPYNPHKIPIIMVHGFWSSPMIWMNMVNDLRSFPKIRQNYQFWFYQYPTSQPFWISATKFRTTLQSLYRNLDPKHQHPKLHQTVLVGHSMGGLLSLMQTLDSQNQMWRLVSNKPFEYLKAPQHIRQNLASTVFFQPIPSIKKVITIATPFQGSRMANDYTKWIGETLFQLPEPTDAIARQLVRENPGLFHNTRLLTTQTSLESLKPEGNIFGFLQSARRNPHVNYHNIYGDTQSSTLIKNLASASDGVVTTSSAKSVDAHTQMVVDADHLSITDVTPTILEIRRILQADLP